MRILLAIFLVLFPGQTMAQDNGVHAQLTTPCRVVANPGQIVSAAVSVSNSTNKELNLSEKISPPPLWSLLIPASGYGLKPGERQLRVVAFRIPPDQPAGDYDVVYRAEALRLSDEAHLRVHVEPVVRIELLREGAPESVIAGESYRAPVRVRNRGNVPVAVLMKVESTPRYRTEIDLPVRFVAAGGSELFSISVMTPEELRSRVDHALTIGALAVAEGPGAGETRAELTVVVPVIPRMSGDTDRYHRLKSHLSLIGLGGDGAFGIQAEFGGAGSLDEAGTRWVDFLFRGPAARDENLFGQWDEYRVGYGDKHVEFHVGDKSYRLSTLSEMGRYGRGAETRLHLGRLEMGAYFFRTRWDEPMIKEAASYLQWRFNDFVSVRTNLLGKVTAEDPWTLGRKEGLATIEAKAGYGEQISLATEYATGRPIDRGADTSDGYRVNLGGKLSNRLRYSYEHLHADPGFAGYYSNTDSHMGQIAFPILAGLAGNFSYRSLEDRNDPLDPGRLKMLNTMRNAEFSTPGQLNSNSLSLTIFGRDSVGLFERSYKGGISYAFPWRTVVSLDYEDFRRKTLVNAPDSDFSERAWTLGIGHVFPRLTIQAYAEKWTLDDRMGGGRRKELGRYSVHAQYCPDEMQSYGAFTQIGNDRYTESASSTKSFGLSGNWSLPQRVRLRLNYQRSVLSNYEDRKLDSLYSSISWTLPNAHTISARLQWIHYQDSHHEDPALFAAYTIPFGVPVSRKTSVGVLRGRVYENGEPGEPPLANVTLNAGGVYAVTDERGEYSFPSLKPGTHYIWADKKSLGFTNVTMEKIPLKVEITGGSTTTLDIAVTKAASLSGVVTTRDGQGIGDILVEARSGERTVTQVTDGRGGFSFEELPPRRWIVKVSGEHLPPLHAFEKDEFEIDLRPGETRELTVKAIPRKRQIMIIDDGVIRAQ